MKKSNGSETAQSKEATCGIVMPISALDGLPADHWKEVLAIMKESIDNIQDPKFTARLVSDADEIGVIQKRIVQNLYNSSIVVCDVSGKNPNVMFELGMRLAFDKPTVIVKDDRTDYSFDTGIIEHISYPRDLRFSRIVEFKERLAEKMTATYKAGQSDPSHSPFLKNFGQFKVASLDEKEVSAEDAILELLSDVQRDVATLKARSSVTVNEKIYSTPSTYTLRPTVIDAARKALEIFEAVDKHDLLIGRRALKRFMEIFTQELLETGQPIPPVSILTKLSQDILATRSPELEEPTSN